jgi:hypothetical protein
MPLLLNLAEFADPCQHEDHPVGWIGHRGKRTLGNMLNAGRQVKEDWRGILEKEAKMVRLYGKKRRG